MINLLKMYRKWQFTFDSLSCYFFQPFIFFISNIQKLITNHFTPIVNGIKLSGVPLHLYPVSTDSSPSPNRTLGCVWARAISNLPPHNFFLFILKFFEAYKIIFCTQIDRVIYCVVIAVDGNEVSGKKWNGKRKGKTDHHPQATISHSLTETLVNIFRWRLKIPYLIPFHMLHRNI